MFGIYFAAMGVAIGVLCCRPTSGKGRREELAEEAKSQIPKVLDLVRQFVKSPSPTNELNMKTAIEMMSKGNQLTLVKACHSIEVKGPDAMESLFEPALHWMFSTASQRAALYGFVKEDTKSSTKLKIDIMAAFEPKGCLNKMSLTLQKKCSQSVNVTHRQHATGGVHHFPVHRLWVPIDPEAVELARKPFGFTRNRFPLLLP